MENPNPNHKALTRGLMILGAFGIVPLLFYWFAIRPPMQRMQGFQHQLAATAMGQPHSYFRMTPAIVAEQATISAFQRRILARVPAVKDTEDLIRYGVVLSNALASEAAHLRLQVSGVEIFNNLVKGQYAPARNGSSIDLSHWPRLDPSLTPEPMHVLSLDMPSLELQMTMRGDYSKVFAFVESLADFPVLANVHEVSVENDGVNVNFRLKVRGYYSASRKQSI